MNYTLERRQEVPHEANESKGVAKPATLKRFIDDGFGLSKINFENSYGFRINGELHRVKHAVKSQKLFRHIVKKRLLI